MIVSPVIRFKKKSDSVMLPSYETDGSSGADLRAYLSSEVILKKGEHQLVPTGLFPEIPFGYEIQVRPRSGLAYKYGITVMNTPGTIDSDYRGEIKVNLINLGDKDYTINNGDRIAQIVISPVVKSVFVETNELSSTSRGEGGFGSTGVK